MPVTLCLGLCIEVGIGITPAQVLAVGVGQPHSGQFEVYLAATGIDLSNSVPVIVDGLGA